MKKLLSVMMVFILVSTHLAIADPASAGKKTDSSITVSINGETLSEKGIVKNGRTFLPVAVIGKKLDLPIEWNGSTKTVVIKGSSTVEVKIGSKQALVNGEVVTLDVPAFVSGGRTMLPVSFIAKHLGISVNYDAKAKMVSIDARQSNQQTPPQPQDSTNPEPQQPSQPSKPDPSQPPAGDREFVLEPLPVIFTVNSEYKDIAPGAIEYHSENFDVPYEERAMFALPDERIKSLIKPITPRSKESRQLISLREVMSLYVDITSLSANSDQRNIPVNIKPGTKDYILWQKAAKTGVFQFLVADNGRIDMTRHITWPEMANIWSNHFYWMEADVESIPMYHQNISTYYFDEYEVKYSSAIQRMVRLGYTGELMIGEDGSGGASRRHYSPKVLNNSPVDRYGLYGLLTQMSGQQLIDYYAREKITH